MPPKRSASVGRFSRLPPNSIRAVPITKRQPSCSRLSCSQNSASSIQQAQILTETVCPDFGDNIVLSKKSLKSFSRLVIPQNIRTLIITHNQISDFVGFNPTDNLENIDLSHNPISSLRGFPTHCGIKTIQLAGTPFSRNQFYRIALILTIGKSLRSIDGDRITASERRVASTYSSEFIQLLRAGWQITYPAPPKGELSKIKSKMAENLRGGDSAALGNSSTSQNSTNSSVKSSNHTASNTQPVIMRRKVKPQSKLYEESLLAQEKEITELTKEIEKLEASTQKNQ